MDTEFKNRLTAAVIKDMESALEDAEEDPVDHLNRHSRSIWMNEDGTVHADMVIEGIPGWIEESNEVKFTSEGIKGVMKLRANPNTPVLNIRNSATATISYRNPETGEADDQEIRPEQQETLDRYAERVAFHATGIANEELLADDPASNREVIDGKELFQELFTRVEEAKLLARELANRGVHSREDPEDGDARAAVAMVYILAAAEIHMNLLADEIWEEVCEEDEEGRWEPIRG